MNSAVQYLKSEFTEEELRLISPVYSEVSDKEPQKPGVFWAYKENGRIFLKPFDTEKQKPFSLDFLSGDLIFRLKSTGKRQPLLKALQIDKNKNIIDGTAGLGRDALTLAFHGAHVVALERNPLLYLMLQEALLRLNKDSLMKNFKGTVKFEHANTETYIKNLPDVVDAIYLDPMYPNEEKDAKSKKEVAILKHMSSATDHLDELIRMSLTKVNSRVVLKRPPQSEFIGQPTNSNTSNLVRFDIYIPGALV